MSSAGGGSESLGVSEDVLVAQLSEREIDVEAVGHVATRSPHQLKPCGVDLNRCKSQVLFPKGTVLHSLGAGARNSLQRTDLNVC